MKLKSHLRGVTRRPVAAQTVQQLKYDTILVYLDNAFNLVFGGLAGVANISNLFGPNGIGNQLPYKGYFGGGSGGGTGTS